MSGSAPTPLQVNPQYSVTESGVGPGAVAVPIAFTLTPAQPVAVVNMQSMPTGTAQISHLQTLKIDNSKGAVGLIVTFIDSGDQIEVGPYEYGYYPCHTNALVFNVAVPFLPSLGGATLAVNMVALNYYVAPKSASFIGPSTDTGVTVTVGGPGQFWNNSISWYAYPGGGGVPVAAPAPAGNVYTSIYADMSKVGVVVQLSSSDIAGNPWSIFLEPATSAEYVIPPTAAGTPVTNVALIPPNSGRPRTSVNFNLTWRPQPLGIPTTSAIGPQGQLVGGFSGTWNNGVYQSMVSAPANFPPFFLLTGVILAAGGLSSQVQVQVTENVTVPVTNQCALAIVGMPAGNSTQIIQGLKWFSANSGWSLGVTNVTGGAFTGTILATFLGISTYASQLAGP